MPSPTIVLLHGAFHQPIHWQPVKTLLESHGYRVVTPALPAILLDGAAASPNCDPDIQGIRTTLEDELKTSNIVLVMHSWSGIPGCSALEGLDRASRQAAGFSTSVIAIAGVSTFLKSAGKSAMDDLPANAANIAEPDKTGTIALMKEDPGPIATYYHDLAIEDAEKWAGYLRPTSIGAIISPCKLSAYEVYPVHYLVCLIDRSYPVEGQRATIKHIQDCGYSVRVEEVDAGHSPFLSKPERTADFIRRTAGEEI